MLQAFDTPTDSYLNHFPLEDAPERQLLASILLRAVLDLITYPKSRHASSARRFLHSKRQAPFSFLWICSNLSIPPRDFLSSLHQKNLL